MKGKGQFAEKRGAGSKCSSSSISRRQVCRCGDEVKLLKSNSSRNPGRMFWRCPNWDKELTCNYFRWADDDSEQNCRFDELQHYEQVIDEMKLKIAKLQRKLAGERTKMKAAICFVVMSVIMSLSVCILAVLNCQGMR
ncbi:Zinc finger, GRF-type [Sesbania bispinosa]|nr:Zinc finger, GRF-type [Sesbania bispinosa]